jgi:hypothetical protein
LPNKRSKKRDAEEGSLCKTDETLEGTRCSFPGEIFYRGILVCDPHARLFDARDRTVLLRGIVSTLDLCLQSLSLRQDTELVETLRFERAEAVQELDQARKELQLAEDAGPVRSS